MLTPSIFGENLFDDFFDDFFYFPAYNDKDARKAERKLYGHHVSNMMKTDVREHDDHYEVDIELPGFKKEELALELKDGYLTITAAKHVQEDETENQTGKFVRRERYTGSMSRSFYVGDEIEQKDIHAKFENGVLTLSVPKQQKNPPIEEKKYIDIEG